jgi:signal transduction histidine kinase
MLREKLIGAWNLVSIVHCPVDGSESVHIMGEKPAGIILYTPDGYVSAQLMREDYAGGSSHDPESSGLTYIAYSGPFRVDEDTQTIMHSMFVSLNPNWQGQTQPRIADLDGTILRLSGPAEIDGRMGEAVVTWERTDERLERFTELLATPIANADSMSELAASRRRIITAADDARRRIERDLHDGTQQRLVSLSLALRIAQSAEPSNCSALQAEIGRAADELDEMLEELRELARGIHPAILSERGLGPALRTLARRAAIPVELDIQTETRAADRIEVAVYYVVSEALTNTTKHARASYAHVTVEHRDALLHLLIRDDGIGGADPAGGSGLIGLRDRVQALSGSIEVNSPPGGGTEILVELPLLPA